MARSNLEYKTPIYGISANRQLHHDLVFASTLILAKIAKYDVDDQVKFAKDLVEQVYYSQDAEFI